MTRTLARLGGCCVLAGLLVAGLLFPVIGGAGLLSNQASTTVDNVSGELAQGQVPQVSTMLDAAGNPIAYLYTPTGRRTVVTGDQIAEPMKQAIVAIEDRRFYEHGGVDWRGTVRAFLSNSSGDAPQQGASTITQQYVKNYLLLVLAQDDVQRQRAVEPTAARKLREIRIALALDDKLGKQEILTRYLNIVPFGTGAYGVQAAAQTYFGTDAAHLNVPQAAMLAGMVQSSSVTPYTNPETVLTRRNVVLDAMQNSGTLSAADAATAKAAPLGVLPVPAIPPNGCAGAGPAQSSGFFCAYALKYLADAGLSPDQVSTGGYTIRTTLDPAVQASAKAAVNRYAPADLDRIASVMDIVAPGQTAHKVLAMADSRTYGFNGAAKETSLLQTAQLESDGAGSVFKLFTTAAAMEQGMGTAAVLDAPQIVRLSGFGAGGCDDGTDRYCVKNYDGGYAPQYPVTQALAQSPNTAFVQLIASTGVSPTVDMAVRLGMRSYATVPSAANPSQSIADEFKKQNLASFTLGPTPINPVELSNVAATLASGGMWCPPTPIESVTDPQGKPVPLNTPPCEQVVPPGLANTLANAMSQDAVSGTAAASARAVGWTLPMAGKTGTTEREYSAAFLGFTNTLAGANLVFDDSPTPGGICHDPLRSCTYGSLVGGQEPARTWFAAMRPIADRFGPVALPPVDQRYVDGSGKGTVPDVRGLASSEASKRISAVGFKVTETFRNDAAQYGTVLGQSITGPAAPGTTISLSVSSGSGASAAPPPTRLPAATPSPITVGPSPITVGPARPGAPPTVLPPGQVVRGVPPP